MSVSREKMKSKPTTKKDLKRTVGRARLTLPLAPSFITQGGGTFRAGGVYVLVLYLPVTSTIKAGGAGTHTFEKGRYAYVGTAHGSGGLRARLSRHTRYLGENKKPKWQIDYVREHARIEEIWCAELPPEYECRWSRALSRLSDTSVPVKGLGSSDCNCCPAHFYRLRRRLPASLLRSYGGIAPNSLVVMEVEPRKRTRKTKLEWEQDYWIGRRMLERVRFEYWLRGEPCPAKLWVKTGNPVLEELTAGTPYKQIKPQLEFANAVDSLIAAHGEWAYRTIFDLKKPQTRKAILQISRKSWERQDDRFTDVCAWDAPSIAPQKGDPSPDTMDFKKILSRIGRAKGPLRIACEILKPQLNGLDERALASISKSLAAYKPHILELTGLIRGMETFEIPLRKQPPAKPENKLPIRKLPGQLASGLSMLVKTNRDIPRSSYDLRPTAEQKTRALEQLKLTRKFWDELSDAMASLVFRASSISPL